VPAGAELALAPGLLPHVTLTQCALRDAPRDRLTDLVARLEARLLGHPIPLRTVAAFAGGFVFWHAEAAAPARAMLQRAHEDALGIADGLLDPVANAAVVQGTMSATDDDPVLVANARAHGYAFVRDRYVPHVTLGFDARLAVGAGGGPAFEARDHPHVMMAERVLVARLGRHARVEAVLDV